MARNCVVLGSGRGGTSLLAGTIARAGFYAGADLYEPRDSNPYGFFEDREINTINERLLEPVTPEFLFGQRWLAGLESTVQIPEPAVLLTRRIQAQTKHEPFCIKDPRFCYTLDAWRPYLGDAAFLCVFRPPLATARSVIREVHTEAYLTSLRQRMTEAQAVSVWVAMYRRVLSHLSAHGDWHFFHYEQLLDGSAIPGLEAVLGTEVDSGFADPRLNRSSAGGRLPAQDRELYRELCHRAGYGRPGLFGRRFRPRISRRPAARLRRDGHVV
jgi:hypothetical protein